MINQTARLGTSAIAAALAYLLVGCSASGMPVKGQYDGRAETEREGKRVLVQELSEQELQSAREVRAGGFFIQGTFEAMTIKPHLVTLDSPDAKSLVQLRRTVSGFQDGSRGTTYLFFACVTWTLSKAGASYAPLTCPAELAAKATHPSYIPLEVQIEKPK